VCVMYVCVCLCVCVCTPTHIYVQMQRDVSASHALMCLLLNTEAIVMRHRADVYVSYTRTCVYVCVCVRVYIQTFKKNCMS